jgi:hypothetical protein
MLNGKINLTWAFELGFNKMIFSSNLGIDFDVYYRYTGDHIGFYSSLYFWKYGFEFNVYNINHEKDEI